MKFTKPIALVIALAISKAGFSAELEQYQALKAEHLRLIHEKHDKLLVKHSSERLSAEISALSKLAAEQRYFLADFNSQISSALKSDSTTIKALISWSNQVVPSLQESRLGTERFNRQYRQTVGELAGWQRSCSNLESRRLSSSLDQLAKSVAQRTESLHLGIQDLRQKNYTDHGFIQEMAESSAKLTQFSQDIWSTRNDVIGLARLPRACADLSSFRDILGRIKTISDIVASLGIEKLEEASKSLSVMLESIDSKKMAFKLKESAIYMIRGVEQRLVINADQSHFEKMVNDKENFNSLIPIVNDLLSNNYLTEDDRNLILDELDAANDRVSKKYFDLVDEPKSLEIKVFRRLRYLGLQVRKLSRSDQFSETEKKRLLAKAKELGIDSNGRPKRPEFDSFSDAITVSKLSAELEDIIGDRL